MSWKEKLNEKLGQQIFVRIDELKALSLNVTRIDNARPPYWTQWIIEKQIGTMDETDHIIALLLENASCSSIFFAN